MAWLTATDASGFLGVSRRSLFRKRELLQQENLAKQSPGGRWLYQSDGLRVAWLGLAEWQVSNGETLAQIEAEVRAEAEPSEGSFWREYGRWAPGERLSDAGREEHACRIAAGMAGWKLEPQEVLEVVHQYGEALASVAAGARWDGEQWHRAETQSLLYDAVDGCELVAAELQQKLAAGEVPQDLVPEVQRVLAMGLSSEQGR
ncbi:hypothetical protein IQ216_00610 [Cyanobium sp. LEGE 06143]|nr:hypothetical protein [Cyanobium sp. LEGE 06143]